ncbi:MAG: hypothetical protein IPM70_12860, partial [Proteobacteria bacterium]|nr:hypothetical protein [Pseudomonadota bacterium]
SRCVAGRRGHAPAVSAPKRLPWMKPSAVLINTAPGPVVDEAALIRALQAACIAGAGLDIYEAEPRCIRACLSLDNVVPLPPGQRHAKTRTDMGMRVARNLEAFFLWPGHCTPGVGGHKQPRHAGIDRPVPARGEASGGCRHTIESALPLQERWPRASGSATAWWSSACAALGRQQIHHASSRAGGAAEPRRTAHRGSVHRRLLPAACRAPARAPCVHAAGRPAACPAPMTWAGRR